MYPTCLLPRCFIPPPPSLLLARGWPGGGRLEGPRDHAAERRPGGPAAADAGAQRGEGRAARRDREAQGGHHQLQGAVDAVGGQAQGGKTPVARERQQHRARPPRERRRVAQGQGAAVFARAGQHGAGAEGDEDGLGAVDGGRRGAGPAGVQPQPHRGQGRPAGQGTCNLRSEPEPCCAPFQPRLAWLLY